MQEESRPVDPYEVFEVETGGQDLLASWYPANDVPEGKRHGSAGFCVIDSGEVVLITHDGEGWSMPGGRPEGDESWEETLRREVMEEACATVLEAQLLGFSRGECIRGHEKGLVLIRSLWLANVRLEAWEPKHETMGRKLVAPDQILSEMPSPFDPLVHRALLDANLVSTKNSP